MYNDFIVHNSKLVVLKFTGTPVINNKYYFPQDGNLSRSIIKALRIPYGDEINSSIIGGEALTVISGNQIKQFFVTLVNKKGDPVLVNMPAYTLVSTNNRGMFRRFDTSIDITKSYVTLNTTTGFSSGSAILFDFYYE